MVGSSVGGLIFKLLFGVVCSVCVIVAIVILYRRWRALAAKAASWPETEGMIQSVNQVVVSGGRTSYVLDVGDFSYKVNNEFYSGRATISRGSSGGDRSTKELVDQKVRVQYDPQEPDAYSFPRQEVGGFVMSTYYVVGSATEVDPIDLNIA